MAMKKGAKIGLGIFAGITAFVVVAVAALFVILYGGRGFKGNEFTQEEKVAVVEKLPVLEKIEQQRAEGPTRGKRPVFSNPKKEQVTLSQGEVNALLAVRDFKAEDLAVILEEVFSALELEAESQRTSVVYKPAGRGPVRLSGTVSKDKAEDDKYIDDKTYTEGDETIGFISGITAPSYKIDEDGNIYNAEGELIGKLDGEDDFFISEDISGGFIKVETDGSISSREEDSFNSSYDSDISEKPNQGNAPAVQGDTQFLRFEDGKLYYDGQVVASLDGKQLVLTDGRVLGTVDKNNDIIDDNKAIIGEIDGDTLVLYGDDITGQVGSLVKLEGISAGIKGDVLSVSIGIARCKTGQAVIDDYLSGSVVVLEFKTRNGRVYLENVKINGLGANMIPEGVLNSLPDYNGGGIIQYLNDNLGEAITATFEHIFAAEEIYTVEIKDGQIYMDGAFYQEVSHE